MDDRFTFLEKVRNILIEKLIEYIIMKIKAIIEFDSNEREFIIPCGTGDKTFKWLAIAASQRFLRIDKKYNFL